MKLSHKVFFKKYMWMFVTLTVLTVIILQLIGFHQYALYMYNSQSSSKEIDSSKVDMVVVLTGSMGRIQSAYELMKSKDIPVLFISGADSTVGFEDLARGYSWDKSISERIEIDNVSTRTLDNARVTRKYAIKNDMKSIVLVTSIYHLQRSVFLFDKVFKRDNIEILPYGTFISPLKPNSWWGDYNVFRNIFIEYLKYQYYKLIMLGV